MGGGGGVTQARDGGRVIMDGLGGPGKCSFEGSKSG